MTTALKSAAQAGLPVPFLDIDKIIGDRETKIIICCGSGGVGKTTTSAAVALRAAEAGRKVVVLTIDPARRLAQALGGGELDNTPRPVSMIDTAAGGSLDQAVRVGLAREIHESTGRVGQQRVELPRVEVERLADRDRGLPRICHVLRVGRDRRPAKAERELDSVAIEDRPTPRRHRQLLAVLARGEVVKGLRLDRLEPRHARERGDEDDREDSHEEPQAPVRLAHRPTP